MLFSFLISKNRILNFLLKVFASSAVKILLTPGGKAMKRLGPAGGRSVVRKRTLTMLSLLQLVVWVCIYIYIFIIITLISLVNLITI